MPDIEVARYGLRTFRPEPAGFMNRGMRLASVMVSGQYWEDGTCSARCIGRLHTWELGTVKWPDHFQIYPEEDSLIAALVRMNKLILWGEGDDAGWHEAPHMGCNCGVYATLTLDHLMAQYPSYAKLVVTVIAAEGRTILGSNGFRTAHARVVAYWCCNHEDVCKACHKQFPDARQFSTIPQMLQEYGLS